MPRKRHLRLQIGEVMASAEPVVLQTLLGSCVAVCLYDPISHIGGMNHILLPGSCATCPGARFGEQAMERLIDQLLRIGAAPKALVAKAFGGANVLPCFQSPTIGEENVRFVRQFLAARGLPLVAQRLGGDHAVQLNFSTDTGKASVRAVDGSRLPAISSAEESYAHSVDITSRPT
jgi:chemotaxis protein CheD